MRLEHFVMKGVDFSIFSGGLSEIGAGKDINQDAFRIGNDMSNDLAYIIIADGLGSCIHSDEGALRVIDITENWIRNKLPEYSHLSDNVANIMIKKIVEEWKNSYEISSITEYDTTLRLAITYKGILFIGGVGDGLAIIKGDEVLCKDLINNKNLFSNVTNSMCSLDVEELFEYEIINDEQIFSKVIILLATDGIADDLIPEKKLTLPKYFQEVIESSGVKTLQKELEEWIEDWKTEGHSDDKTLCYLAIERENI